MNSRPRNQEDRRLLDAINRVGTIRGAARLIGISENAAIGRYHRMNRTVFPCDIAAREAAKARKAAKRAAEVAAIDAMRAALKAGRDRRTAVRAARTAGARFFAIGRALGISKQAVEQYLSYGE